MPEKHLMSEASFVSNEYEILFPRASQAEDTPKEQDLSG